MFLAAEDPGCAREDFSPLSNPAHFLPTDSGPPNTGLKALPPFLVMRGHRWVAAHGSIYDFNWWSRAHPCEHTHSVSLLCTLSRAKGP